MSFGGCLFRYSSLLTWASCEERGCADGYLISFFSLSFGTECRNNIHPTYMPRAADVWSLGIVLINMCVFILIFLLSHPLTHLFPFTPLLLQVVPLQPLDRHHARCLPFLHSLPRTPYPVLPEPVCRDDVRRRRVSRDARVLCARRPPGRRQARLGARVWRVGAAFA